MTMVDMVHNIGIFVETKTQFLIYLYVWQQYTKSHCLRLIFALFQKMDGRFYPSSDKEKCYQLSQVNCLPQPLA